MYLLHNNVLKVWKQNDHPFWRYLENRYTQTDRQTDTGENIITPPYQAGDNKMATKMSWIGFCDTEQECIG